MHLSTKQISTLRLVCSTLVPGSPADLPDLVAETVATTGNPRDLHDLRMALSLLEAPLGTLVGAGRLGRFSQQSVAEREMVLRGWAAHQLPQLRQAFQAVKRLACFLAFSDHQNPVLDALNYQPDTTPHAPEPTLRVEPLRPEEDSLTADAVVIGSGSGGSVAAAQLAARGLQVIVLERGGFYAESELGMPERDGMIHLMLDRGMTASRDLSLVVMAGSTVGGGSLINWTACLAPPEWLRAEWESVYGLEGLTSPEFADGVQAVQDRLGVHTGESACWPESSAGRLEAGCRALGYHWTEAGRNVRGCGENCNFCIFGCRSGAKQSTVRTYLADAVEHGARVIPRAQVQRVLVTRGEVYGVEVIVGGKPLQIRTARVVLAAGAIGSPAILLRSGIDNPNIGRHLHVHPVLPGLGLYEERTAPWKGRLLSGYSAQYQHLDGNYGFLLELAPAHPGMAAMLLPWQAGKQFQTDVGMMDRIGIFLALIRDRGSGQVTVDRSGRHRIDYRISPYDQRHLLMGQTETLKLHRAAGAQRVMTLHSRYNAFDLSEPGFEQFLDRTARLRCGPNHLPILSAHQMGTCRLGRSPVTAVADPTGQVFGVRGLYICDTSAFPSASGVNPMITAMSLAHWIAAQIR